MASSSVTVSSRDTSQVIPIDLRRHKAGVGLIVTVAAGSSLTYSLEITGDKLRAEGYNPASGNWNKHDTINNQSESKNGTLIFPVTGVRLNVSTWTSGSVTLSVIQTED
jgi:hypothetical protein